MPDGEALESALDHVISETLAATGDMVNRWIALVEVVSENGERGVWSFVSAGMMRWDSVGLLQHGLMTEQAASLADEIRRD